MSRINSAASPTKLCVEFSSGDTIDIEMKKSVVGAFLPGDFQIHTSRDPFIVTLNFLPPLSHLLVEAPLPFCPLINLFRYC